MKTHEVYRVVTFLPIGDDYITVQDFLDRVNEAIPLSYGNYDSVAYYSHGTERFRPLEGSNPTSGNQGEVSTLQSTRIEISVPLSEELLNQCLEFMVELHPWEEPVIHAYKTIETISQKEQQAEQ